MRVLMAEAVIVTGVTLTSSSVSGRARNSIGEECGQSAQVTVDDIEERRKSKESLALNDANSTSI